MSYYLKIVRAYLIMPTINVPLQKKIWLILDKFLSSHTVLRSQMLVTDEQFSPKDFNSPFKNRISFDLQQQHRGFDSFHKRHELQQAETSHQSKEATSTSLGTLRTKLMRRDCSRPTLTFWWHIVVAVKDACFATASLYWWWYEGIQSDLMHAVAMVVAHRSRCASAIKSGRLQTVLKVSLRVWRIWAFDKDDTHYLLMCRRNVSIWIGFCRHIEGRLRPIRNYFRRRADCRKKQSTISFRNHRTICKYGGLRR